MKFSVGDMVILKQTGEEGYVSAYICKDMLEVEVHGTTFPVYIDEVDHPYLKWFTEKKSNPSNGVAEQLPVEKAAERPQRLARGFYISFLPIFKQEGMEEIVDFFKVFLLNEMPVPVKLCYDLRLNHNVLFSHEGTLHPFGNLYLHNIAWEDITAQPRFNWRLNDAAGNKMKCEEGMLRIKPAKLFEHVNDLMFNNSPSFSYCLIDDFVPEVNEKQGKKFEPHHFPDPAVRQISAGSELPKYVLDLHIEHLVENTRGMDNADMLQIQLNTFERYLHLAIVHNQERMFVIHGLGKGVLKEAIHEILAKVPEVRSYANDYHPKYGFGATEIIFKR